MAKNDSQKAEINARISEIREYFCSGNNLIFSKKLGISAPRASNLCNTEPNVGKEAIERILDAFPKYNDALKVIASICGIHKPLSSHWARHTGATLLLNAGVDMEVVAKVLGHATTRITRSVYAKLLDNTIAAEMSKMI